MNEVIERFGRWLQNTGFDGGPDGPAMRAYELLQQQAEQIASLSADKARLDYLDRCNEALNKQTGSKYQWSLIQSHNVNRLMLEHFAVDLHDSAPVSKGLPSCRDAIDQRMREISARREAQR